MAMLSMYECVQHTWRMLAVTGVLVMYSMTASAAAEGITIEEAVRLALHDNPALQAQQQMTTAAEGELRQAQTFPHNPRLEWEGPHGPRKERRPARGPESLRQSCRRNCRSGANGASASRSLPQGWTARNGTCKTPNGSSLKR